ncbi:prepilin-type N-terminal cleavage/methylation domain-containing protein [Patescibacteria group bacterium]|nr:prepilin-type N-terminal cleavage/methylation domain-containing protein [Patescibacteria group bacterium]
MHLGFSADRRTKFTKGFTLVELLISISLIAILSGVLFSVINPLGIQKKSRDAQRMADLSKVKVALESYFADNRRYPTRPNWVKVSALSPELEGPYINLLPIDPKSSGDANCSAPNWRDYYYKTNGSGSVYVLFANLELAPTSPYSCPSGINCSGCNLTGVNVYYTTAD